MSTTCQGICGKCGGLRPVTTGPVVVMSAAVAGVTSQTYFAHQPCLCPPPEPLTEDRVRQIVMEELERMVKK